MNLRPSDVDLLRCPTCRRSLAFDGTRSTGGHLGGGTLSCGEESWPVREGIPVLYREEWVRGTDRLLRVLYDGLPGLHNPAVRYLLPLVQLGGTEASLRGGYLRRLELPELRPPPGRPLRILEVGVGAGANIPLVFGELATTDLEYWGLDLSAGMLGVCRRMVRRARLGQVRLLLGDAHALPFADNTFDRVFHVGGIGGYADPRRALREMARVALPSTPIVVVDEQLDPSRRHTLFHRAMFRLITFYDRDPHCPREALPDTATDLLEEQVSRFYYSLRFRVPKAQE